MDQSIHIQRFDNGLTLLGECMPWLRSTAFTMLLPAGTVHEPESRLGLSGLTAEMVQRGAGKFNSRQMMEELDYLGVDRNVSNSTYHTSFSTAMPRETLPSVLELYADTILQPHLPKDQFEDARQSSLQELRALEDELAQKCFVEMKQYRYPGPLGRSPQGNWEGLESATWDDVRQFYQDYYRPDGAILAVAGNFSWPELVDQVSKLFASWKSLGELAIPPVETRNGTLHLEHPSAQTHLVLAYNCLPYGHPKYYQSRGLVGVLSDGMSSRLFTEVREKRGLVYSIYAVCQTLSNTGSVFCYAGTTQERAQETLDVTLQTIDSLADGIHEDEVRRLLSRVKSVLVMEQESSASRSSQMASDWYLLGRITTREEVIREIDQLSSKSLLDHFHESRPSEFSLVTLGQEPLELRRGISVS